MATEQLTYDPLVDGQSLPRVRLLSPLRPPPPGRALVLVPDSGPALTIRPGERVPDAVFGVYQGMFTVDTTEHMLILPIHVAGRDAAYGFRCRVSVLCQVADPAQVVARGIRDMGSTVYGPARERLRKVSRGYGIGQFHEAEEAMNAALRDFTADPVVRLRDAHVELLLDGATPTDSGRPHGPPPGTPTPGVPSAGAASAAAPSAGPRRSRVRGARGTGAPAGAAAATGAAGGPPTGPGRTGTGTGAEPGEPVVLRGEVVARRDEPVGPAPRTAAPVTDPPPRPDGPPPPPPDGPPRRRTSRVRGVGATGGNRGTGSDSSGDGERS